MSTQPVRILAHALRQAVIADITRRMGAGMAKFIAKNEVDTVAEYDEYCHFVAGLVGIGLSQMFGERCYPSRAHRAWHGRTQSGCAHSRVQSHCKDMRCSLLARHQRRVGSSPPTS